MNELLKYRFALACLLPLAVASWVWVAPQWVGVVMLGYQLFMAGLERVPGLQHSPPATPHTTWHRTAIRLHVPLQAGLMALALWVLATQNLGVWAAVSLAIGVGGVAGIQGISFAHELGHSKTKLDRLCGWLLMGSVSYAHFMVEHYRGHHPRAATLDDPASARQGESLWRFLPRTLGGGLRSAWRLEAQQLRQLKRSWRRSPLLWASLGQAAWLVLVTAWLGPLALLFWLVQSAYAVFLLEAINYIEHYGLQREVVNGKREPFGMMHAWSADHLLTNSMVANLQRHPDHHMHAWKPYAELQALPGPQLPTGYAGCLFLAAVPALWFRAMDARLGVSKAGALKTV
jgi:alkane 1-monooxygenase